MLLRQVQARPVQGDHLRALRRRGHAPEGAPRAPVPRQRSSKGSPSPRPAPERQEPLERDERSGGLGAKPNPAVDPVASTSVARISRNGRDVVTGVPPPGPGFRDTMDLRASYQGKGRPPRAPAPARTRLPENRAAPRETSSPMPPVMRREVNQQQSRFVDPGFIAAAGSALGDACHVVVATSKWPDTSHRRRRRNSAASGTSCPEPNAGTAVTDWAPACAGRTAGQDIETGTIRLA